MVFAAALAAATFFGCSNSSSDNNALLSGVGNNTTNNMRAPDRTGLPANVGINELIGKTFSRENNGITEKYAFGSDTVAWIRSNVSGNVVWAYSYNSTTKQLFMKVTGMPVQFFDYAYDGSTLKMSGSKRYPAGQGLDEIYKNFLFNSPMAIVNNSGANNGYWLYDSDNTERPNIMSLNPNNRSYRVSSITESAINTSADATQTGTMPNMTWTYTPVSRSFNYTTNKTESGATFTIEDLGKITIDYATADNVPNVWTDTYTQE